MSGPVRKICLLGDFGVGKTSTVRRFVQGAYDDKYLTTVGVKIDTKAVELDADTSVKFVIWDIAGTDTATAAYKSYLRGAAGYLLVVDGTRPATLQAAQGLRAQLDELLDNAPWIGLLNKADLADQWALDDAQIAALEASGQVWLRSSALTGENVEEAFRQLAQRMVA